MATYVELTETVPEHVCISDADAPLCGADCREAVARVVPNNRDPIENASIHLCHDCADEWIRIADDVDREPTVQCACDRAEDGHIWKCAEVAPASVARALRHPDANSEYLPVCPDCYDWIREHPTSGVDTPVDDAPTWAEISQTA